MLALVCGDVGDGSKDVTRMSSSTFDTIPVVDTTLTSFSVDVKVLQIVVEIHGTSTQIAAKESSMGRKNSRNVNVSLATKGDS